MVIGAAFPRSFCNEQRDLAIWVSGRQRLRLMARRDASSAGLRWERASRVIYRLAVRPNTSRGRHGLAVWPGPGADWGGASRVPWECRAGWTTLGADWGPGSKVAWGCGAGSTALRVVRG